MNTVTVAIPIQLGPDYCCFTCGEPAVGGHYWLCCRSPLDAYAANIYYLALPCGHNPRTVRLGDAITPLAFVLLPDFQAQILANVTAIEEGLTLIREDLAQPHHA